MNLFRLTEQTPPHLSKVPDVKQVESLEQLTLLHAEHLAARRQEGPDVLQAQELWEEHRFDWRVSPEIAQSDTRKREQLISDRCGLIIDF